VSTGVGVGGTVGAVDVVGAIGGVVGGPIDD